ncbi:MAG TPA: PAAR domain-containing protein, partial [Candidatus Krumholzibacteria bacterium]|nr:PAAR domain-containing protein [Candidatus Krumholzibacteria bacterium]
MMPAAKSFDPVMGVDVHIIQPPGPVPPRPIPHPFIGMLIDPFDFVPIIGATVYVNGSPRALAGTAGKALPPHIPIGGMFVPPPPGNECEMFMGSSTVIADGDPFSYTALPALSCQSIGMPAPFRTNPKKKTKMKSLVLPTSVVLPIPMGPPVLVGGSPTISMMAIGMRVGMAGLGAAFKKLRKMQKASRKMKAVSDRIQAAAAKAMKKLGVPPSAQNKVRRAICSVTGHPVDV